MFMPLNIPFGSVMLFNVLKLKANVRMEDIEMAVGEMCNVVKNTYGDDKGGFIGGQVFKYNGFVSKEGSFDTDEATADHVAILTYWKSFEQHEHSHADRAFREKFDAVAKYCDETHEIGYEMMWQGEPEKVQVAAPKTATKRKASTH